MMDSDFINKLVIRASKLTSSQTEVIGWIPPKDAGDSPDGVFVTKLKRGN